MLTTLRIRHAFLTIVAAIGITYAGAAAWLLTQETRLVFDAGRPLSQARPSFPYEQVEFGRTDGGRQFAWVMKSEEDAERRPWVLYLHGNGATIASRVNIARYQQLRALGLNVFAPEYRGFGGLDGVPTESSLGADARAAYDYLRTHYDVSPHRIVVYGWSLGGPVAVELAAAVQQAAVILEGAPASIVAIGQQRYPLFPIRLLIQNPFDAILKVGRIQAPILFLHSPEDVVIPIAEGRRLFDAVTGPKRFVEVRGGHVDAAEADSAVFFGAIREFLQELLEVGAGLDTPPS
jgi:dipeptidyl aminopeptidase/acylaminoacyl peptidase